MEPSLKRHILKTVSYRVIATFVTIMTGFILGLSIELSSLLGLGELMIKPMIYFCHERLWYKYIRIKK